MEQQGPKKKKKQQEGGLCFVCLFIVFNLKMHPWRGGHLTQAAGSLQVPELFPAAPVTLTNGVAVPALHA